MIFCSKNSFLFLLSLFIGISAISQSKVSGLITDSKSGEPLYGATIYDKVSKKGTVTNEHGFYVLTSKNDSLDLFISFVGYKNFAWEGVLKQNKTLNVPLVPSLNLKTVEVTAERKTFEPVGTKMSAKFIKTVPMFLGENDVLKAAQFIPGIQSAGEAVGGLVVRGGSPDQNLILLDGVPVYNAYHLFGLFSVFSPEVVQNTYILKGAFPARYSGRLSSVLDIQTTNGSKEKINASYGLGPILSHVHLEGPLDSAGKTTFVLSGRRSFLDILAQPFILAETDGEARAGFHFHDFNAKFQTRISDRDKIYVSAYHGVDKFGVTLREVDYDSKLKAYFRWGNTLARIGWTRQYANGIFMNTSAYFSQYRLKTAFTLESPEEEIEEAYYSGIRDFALKSNWETAYKGHTLRWGGHAVAHQFSPGIIQSYNNTAGEDIVDRTQGKEISNTELMLFGEWEYSITKKLKSNLGFNMSALLSEGNLQYNPDPRLKLTYLTDRLEQLVLGYSEMTQYVHLLTNPSFSSPTDMWLTATNDLPAGEARQISFTYIKPFEKIELELGVFGKQMQNLVEAKEGAPIMVITENWEENIERGKGRSYGFEFGVKKDIGKFNFSLAYTYSRSFRQFENINLNQEFAYKYDRPHYFTHTGRYEFSKNKILSWGFTLSSGQRITLPSGILPNPKVYHERTTIGSERNGYQLPIYHRLDIAYEVRKQKKRGYRAWKFGVLNAYGRANANFVDPFYDTYDKSKGITAYSLIPFLPSFKWERVF